MLKSKGYRGFLSEKERHDRNRNLRKKGVEIMIELDQIKYELTDRATNLKELGDSL
jgi:hypothetical protein